jgi:integrase/recombinase XerD
VEDISISAAFELYRVEFIVFRNQSARTEEMNGVAMKSLIQFTGDIMISELSFDLVRKWKEHLTKSKSDNTVRGYIIKLRVVLNHLRLRGFQNVLQPEVIGVPKRSQTVVNFITPLEVERLIDCVFTKKTGYSTLNRYRNRAMVSMLYASGVRVSELCALDRLSIREDGTFTIIGKGGKVRLCFTDHRTTNYLREYQELRNDNNSALFISELTGKRISKDTVQAVFRNATAKAGFEKPVHPHTLRHSFATNLLQNNTNLVYVRDFLGHKSVQTTEMYTHVVNEDLKRIYSEKHSV